MSQDLVSVNDNSLQVICPVSADFNHHLQQAYDIWAPWLSQEYQNVPEMKKPLEEMRAQIMILIETFKKTLAEGETCMKQITSILELLDNPEETDITRLCTLTQDTHNIATSLMKNGEQATEEFSRNLVKIKRITVKESQRQLMDKANGKKSQQDTLSDAQAMTETVNAAAKEGAGANPISAFIFIALTPFLKLCQLKINRKLEKKKEKSHQLEQEYAKALLHLAKFSTDLNLIWENMHAFSEYWPTLRLSLINLHNFSEEANNRQGGLAGGAAEDIMELHSHFVCYTATIKDIIAKQSLDRDPTMKGDFENFEKQLRRISTVFDELKTAKSIISHSHAQAFTKNVASLRNDLIKQLETIRIVLDAWVVHLRLSPNGPTVNLADIAQMQREAPDVVSKPYVLIIQEVLQSETSPLRSHLASMKQKKEEENGYEAIQGRRVATRQEALDTFMNLQTILETIKYFSTEFGMALFLYGSNASSTPTESKSDATPPKELSTVGVDISDKALCALDLAVHCLKSMED